MLELDANNELHTQIQYRLIEKLTQSERRYRELVENLREIVFECDEVGTLTFLNRAWFETLGYEVSATIGKTLDCFLRDIELWQAALQGQTDANLVLCFVHQTGRLLWLELSMRIGDGSKWSGSLVDVTERRRVAQILRDNNEDLENRVKQRTAELSQANCSLTTALKKLRSTQGQLIQTEKMSSLGQLVAGVAHEINNPVNFVHGNLEPAREYAQKMLAILDLYQQHYPEPMPIIQDQLEALDIDFLKADFPKLLDSMRMGAQRIQQIVVSLRNFSRLDESAIKTVNIHEGLDNTLLILGSRLRTGVSGIRLVKQYSELPLIECLPGELNQVFMNLISNAIDALEEDPKFKQNASWQDGSQDEGQEAQITIKTQRCGDRAIISIADNGPGVPAVNVPKLFDPFFTTKPVGKGTGLGLSISHQIITERHSGELICQSTMTEGTTFTIQLPLSLGCPT